MSPFFCSWLRVKTFLDFPCDETCLRAHGFQMSPLRKEVELPVSKASIKGLHWESLFPWNHPHYPIILTSTNPPYIQFKGQLLYIVDPSNSNQLALIKVNFQTWDGFESQLLFILFCSCLRRGGKENWSCKIWLHDDN